MALFAVLAIDQSIGVVALSGSASDDDARVAPQRPSLLAQNTVRDGASRGEETRLALDSRA
jgi:hypothetical protein